MTQRDLQSLPDFFDLPESIYGAAMMAVVRSSQTYRKTVHGVTSCVFVGLGINIFTQFYVLYCTKLYICAPAIHAIRELYAHYHQEVFIDGVFSHDAWENFDHAESLCQVPLSQPMFFMAILTIWTATCWVDLSESFRYLLFWCNLRQPEHSHATEVDFCDGNVLTTAASRRTKISIVVFVLVPKVMIAMYLWLLGARWLTATTGFQDLILNAVALAFITELDELIYAVVVPEDIQGLVRMYKITRQCCDSPLPIPGALKDVESFQTISNNRDKKFRMRIAWMLGVMFIVFALPVVYMYRLQHVLPNYHWDVHAPCQARIADLIADECMSPAIFRCVQARMPSTYHKQRVLGVRVSLRVSTDACSIILERTHACIRMSILPARFRYLSAYDYHPCWGMYSEPKVLAAMIRDMWCGTTSDCVAPTTGAAAAAAAAS
eukprot:CAMPEP_0115187034 /NCGR_PEP_ID=MMETSP0270-20121206/10288_1 /TAXON_ID=71861 /ORGANISM="Scrippsiella trochoidea, Strain CCMP3099" /LENGTH=434 /DNA_ID=CAMNT_0002600175 /DNA_START=164 /DNA_END=1466 /DNA_ORIENTATION=-